MHEDADSVSTESPSYFSYLGEHKTDWPASPRVKTSRSQGKHLRKIGRGSPRVTFEVILSMLGTSIYMVNTYIALLMRT